MPQPSDVANVMATLKRRSRKARRDGMARYGIPSDKAFGVPVGALRQLAKTLGQRHEAEALWQSGHYEARMLATFVAQPARMTALRMGRWCRDFDNWAICDSACLALFDRTPHAFAKLQKWAKRKDEFVTRAAFALLASLAVHDKAAPHSAFLRCLPLIEEAAEDPRHVVKKSIDSALRSVGKRSAALNRACIELAERLTARPQPTPRWVGKGALREPKSASVQKRLAGRNEKA